MTPAERRALKDARGYAAAGRIRFTRHAEQRVQERCAGLPQHVREAILTATRCSAQANSRYRLSGGTDLDGDDLTVVIVLDEGVLVITLF